MHPRLEKYLQSKISLSEEETALISNSVSIRKLRRNQYLLQEGDVCRFAAFVAEGCLRTYRIDEKGQERIIYFAVENWWAGDRESYTSEAPSRYYIDAVEDAEIVMFSRDNFEKLTLQVPAFGKLINTIMQKGFIASQNRIHAALSYSAEEKYIDFLSVYPDLANRLPQQMIASFLGITPETLSRIRNLTQKRSR